MCRRDINHHRSEARLHPRVCAPNHPPPRPEPWNNEGLFPFAGLGLPLAGAERQATHLLRQAPVPVVVGVQSGRVIVLGARFPAAVIQGGVGGILCWLSVANAPNGAEILEDMRAGWEKYTQIYLVASIHTDIQSLPSLCDFL